MTLTPGQSVSLVHEQFTPILILFSTEEGDAVSYATLHPQVKAISFVFLLHVSL